MPEQLAYDPTTQGWVPSPASANGGAGGSVVAASPSSSPATPTPAAGEQSQVNSSGQANKAQAELEYNTLEGDLVLKASIGVLKIKQDTTIQIEGIGKYLSGTYYVTSVTYSLDANEGFGMTCTLIKTGFGPSLKSPAPVTPPAVREEPVKKEAPASFKTGDTVRIVGDGATYSNASDGVKVPNWVKQKNLTIQQMSKDGTRALVQPIFSWTYIKYLQKV